MEVDLEETELLLYVHRKKKSLKRKKETAVAWVYSASDLGGVLSISFLVLVHLSGEISSAVIQHSSSQVETSLISCMPKLWK